MSDKENTPEEESKEGPPSFYVIDTGSGAAPTLASVELFGSLDEEQLAEIIHSLVKHKERCKEEKTAAQEDEKKEIIEKPINFYISTWGGDALAMFAIYDLMRDVRKTCTIETFGMGKVMSAGVLLLAAGTKGQRKIGKNCRVMIHNVRGGHYGSLPQLENELDETKWIQSRMVDAIAAETKMTRRFINKMLDTRLDTYLSAEEAVKYGIADIIV